LAAVHVYFPDPWWKRRHRKRRMVADDVVALLAKITQIGGELRLATDVGEYADAMRKTVANCVAYRQLPAWVPDRAGNPEDRTVYLTHFERKFRLQGKPTWRIRYERVDRPGNGGNNQSGVTP
jgi:tRNA (guanine-N7-)-methyltransferase